MGRLVGLELHNFKSYRGTSSIGFGSSYFTSIIGPNGSGKSNMMDAISFVLGIRSSHLRSTNLKDLIYRGRIMNDDENSDEDDAIDNDENSDPSTAYVMAIYEKANGEILKLKRSIGESGQSEYKINNKVVSASQYTEVLKKENILIKARNFLVFQGDVEKIASQSSVDLTKLIETISGSIEYKKDYDLLVDQKEKAHDDTALKNSRKRTLREELNQYKGQCLEMKEFDLKTKELGFLHRDKYMIKLYHNNLALAESEKNIKLLENSLKQQEDEYESKQNELKESMKLNSKDSNKLKKIESEISRITNDIKDEKFKLIPIKSEILELSKKIENYKKRISSLNLDKEDQNEVVERTKNQLNTILGSFKNFQDEHTNSEAADDGDTKPHLIQEYNSLRQLFLIKGGYIETRLLDLNEEKTTIVNQIENLNKQKDIVDFRSNDLKAIKNELLKKKSENGLIINENLNLIKIKKANLNELEIKRDSVLKEEYELNLKLKEVLVKLNEANANQRESNRDKKLRENCLVLKKLFPGVKGLVYDLCKPKQKKFELALSTILGKNFDSIVVDNLNTATKCIEYLKDQRLGFASFIPLDTVESKLPSNFLRTINDKVRPTLDVVDYDSSLEKAIQYVVSNSVICDNMDLAKYIKWEKKIDVKIVTLDGSLIHKSGLMTGGKLMNSSNKRWDKVEVQNLINDKNDLKSKLDELAMKRPSDLLDKKVMNELRHLEDDLPNLRESNEKLQRGLNDIEATLKNQIELNEELNSEIEVLNSNLTDLNGKIEETESNLQHIQMEIYSGFCQVNGLENINKYEELHGSRLRDYSKEKSRYLKQIQHLENKLDFEVERSTDILKRLQKLETDKNKFELNLKNSNDLKSEIQNNIDNLESELEVLKEEFEEINEKNKSNNSASFKLEESINDIKLNLNEIKSKISSFETSLETSKINKFNILRNCKLENISIPLIFGSLDELQMDDSENDKDVVDEIEIDFKDLDSSYKDANSDLARLDESIQQKIDELSTQLSLMNPNRNAVDRLSEVADRLKELDTDFSKAKELEKAIINNFQDIRSKRYKLFMDAFNHISNKIDSIYKELTKSNVSPLGGSAYLTLEDEDEPYLSGVKYHAMPPMKRFRDMELLSGGEKTIASLSLLFSINSFNQSPFFILDEVDAALDNANINKIANYICNNSGPDFQFIVISLKNGLFERSDSLVGIYREQEINSSRTLTMDLRGYPDEEVS